MQQISQLLKKMFQKIYNPFRPDFYCPSNGSNPLFSMIPQRQGASGKSSPVKARGGQGIIHAQKRPQAAARIRVTQKPVKKISFCFLRLSKKNVLSVSINRDGKPDGRSGFPVM